MVIMDIWDDNLVIRQPFVINAVIRAVLPQAPAVAVLVETLHHTFKIFFVSIFDNV
jgi:hypothetical protein